MKESEGSREFSIPVKEVHRKERLVELIMYPKIEEWKKIEDSLTEWLHLYLESDEAQSLPDDDFNVAPLIIVHFSDYMFHYLDLSPKDWSKDGVKTVLLELFPNRLVVQESTIEAIVPVLRSFFLFLQREEILLQGGELAKTITRYGERMEEGIDIFSKWGIVKRYSQLSPDDNDDFFEEGSKYTEIVEEIISTLEEDDPVFEQLPLEIKVLKYLSYCLLLKEKGELNLDQDLASMMGLVDLFDDPDEEDWDDEEEDWEEKDWEEKDWEEEDSSEERGVPKTIIKEEKVGRNAPCPCGSGKKYKKCCLNK